LKGVSLGKVKSPGETVLIFETDGGWNLSGGPELLLNTPRHSQSITVGFADGHVEQVKPARVEQLRWDP
jgi:prepilin-type processing-associated H-X9-DG protein